jgi:hypothetical protein
MNEKGDQVIRPVGILSYSDVGGQVEEFAEHGVRGIQRSLPLRDSLWLNGRRSRNAADFFMIYEYAKKAFGGKSRVAKALRVTMADLTRLHNSANNLAPMAGGRHAGEDRIPEWDASRQMDFISTFLRKWVLHEGRAHV